MAAFPFDTPNNTDSIQTLLFRIASQLYQSGGQGAGGIGQATGTYSVTIAGGGGYTNLPPGLDVSSVTLINASGVTMDVLFGNDPVTANGPFQLQSGIGTQGSIVVYPQSNAGQIRVRRSDQGAASTTLGVIYKF